MKVAAPTIAEGLAQAIHLYNYIKAPTTGSFGVVNWVNYCFHHTKAAKVTHF